MRKIIYWLLILFSTAILVHVSLILAIPHFAQTYLWKQLTHEIPPFNFIKLDTDNPIMKTKDPAFEAIVCRFDLTDSPMEIIARQVTPFWTMAIYNEKGERFFSTNQAINTEKDLRFLLATPLQIVDLTQWNKVSQPVVINSPFTQGFILLRIALLNESWKREVREMITSAQCNPYTVSPPSVLPPSTLPVNKTEASPQKKRKKQKGATKVR